MRTLLREILNANLGSDEPDADLLRRFANQRDGDAFAQLVRRYGGLVWGQCRHLLANEADADDAFQATFLVLARSAKSIRAVDRLGPWLHGVAYRVCQNARRQAARRARREQASATPEATHPVADSAWESVLAAVHEELHRLPEKLRVAFILCYLEGKGTSEAAEQLGLKLGTFSARLSRAKEQLLARLSARGLAAGAGVLAMMTGGPARAALIQRAVDLVVTTMTIPAAILTLTNGVLIMGITKLKVACVCVLVAGVLALGGLWSVQAQPPGSSGGGAGLFGGPGMPGGQPPRTLEGPALQAEIERLRAQIAAKEAELVQRQAELERQRLAAQAGTTGEFRYVAQQPGYAPNPAEFEKAIRAGETDGYRFVGVVTLSMPEKDPKILRVCEVPTLVFRKSAAGLGGVMGGSMGAGFGSSRGSGAGGLGGPAGTGLGRPPE